MNTKTLFIVRGLPGSGKSTLARQLVKEPALYHHEADQFFMTKTGEYRYNPDLIGAAHQFCYENVKANMEGEIPNIAVSNTFTTKKEIQPYLDLCALHGYTPFIIVCTNNFGNIHNVPEAVIDKMKKRWQD